MSGRETFHSNNYLAKEAKSLFCKKALAQNQLMKPVSITSMPQLKK
jgi:hypothetical protein